MGGLCREHRLRHLFNSSLFCRYVRSTVRCSADTFVQQFVVLLKRSFAEFTCALLVSTPSSTPASQGPCSTPASRSSLVVSDAHLILFSVERDARHLEH